MYSPNLKYTYIFHDVDRLRKNYVHAYINTNAKVVNGEEKRYFKIDQHLVRHFVNYVECLSSTPSFLCSQIIIPFLNSRIPANHNKGFGF